MGAATDPQTAAEKRRGALTINERSRWSTTATFSPGI
jgi:hypothetical protein